MCKFPLQVLSLTTLIRWEEGWGNYILTARKDGRLLGKTMPEIDLKFRAVETRIENLFKAHNTHLSHELKFALIGVVQDENKLHESKVLSETVRQFANWRGPERKR